MGNLSDAGSNIACISTAFDVFAGIREMRRLAILTTDRCQARCGHCLTRSGPEQTQVLNLDEMIDVIDCLIQRSAVGIVVFTGGESTLLGDDLFEIIAYCSERGIPTRLVTNAAWAHDDISAEKMIRDLRDVGLTEINFSTDDFHCDWIPFENVERAWAASKGKGFGSVLIAVCENAKSKITSEFIVERMGETVSVVLGQRDFDANPIAPAEDGTRYCISRSSLARLGRGENLSQDYFPAYDQFDKAGLYGACSSLFDPLTLNADGSLGVCCGALTQNNPILNLGKASNVLHDSEYDLDEFQRLVLRAIQTIGPAYLYHIATESATDLAKLQARNVCEICERLTTDERMLHKLKEKSRIIAQQIEDTENLRRFLAQNEAGEHIV